ncbi:MAG: hypothetical protein R3E97_06050 [Candidatus Eisenbacteria bacterium]
MTFPKEYRQILDMLAEGKITAEEAQRLMEKLGGSSQRGADTGAADAGSFSATEEAASEPRVRTAVLVQPGGGAGNSGAKGTMPKYLRILVNSSDGDEVNIRVPLQLVRAGLKLSTVLPNDAKDKITEKGIDLSKLGELEGEALIEALRELSVDVDSSDGDVVRIFCE